MEYNETLQEELVRLSDELEEQTLRQLLSQNCRPPNCRGFRTPNGFCAAEMLQKTMRTFQADAINPRQPHQIIFFHTNTPSPL